MTCSQIIFRQQHPRTVVQKPVNTTNLSLGEDWEEDIRNGVTDRPRSNEQDITNGVEGARLDKHGYGGLIQSADPG